jgi:hypothetical protein
MNWRGRENKRSWHNQRHYSRICLEVPKKEKQKQKPVWIVGVPAEIRTTTFRIWVRNVTAGAYLLVLEGQEDGYKTDFRKSQVGILGKRREQPRSMLMIKKLVLLAKTRNSTSCRGGRLWQRRPGPARSCTQGSVITENKQTIKSNKKRAL